MTWHYHPDDEVVDHEPDYLSVKHYLLYWKIDPIIRPEIAQHKTTSYAASNYLKRVKPGDVLWIVTVHRYRLYLLGRLKVEFVVDDTSIAQELVEPQPEEWYEADWYAISNKYAIEPMREINITHIADKLRFNSRVSEMLDIHEGKIDVQQVRTLRQLDVNSAQMMDDVWYNEAYTPQSVQDFLELSEDDMAYSEGKTVVRTVKQRQRSRQLVKDAKAQFRQQHEGRLFCEVCGFDYEVAYGVDYIEAHHTEPLSSLNDETENTTEAVVLLCANCHRVVHSRTPPYPIDELKSMLKNKDENNHDNHNT
ncbi:MAG: HNH endonuclease [Anaerolineae bacterium]|nr:HNH endonuclease [Anaerolineae bacterium]